MENEQLRKCKRVDLDSYLTPNTNFRWIKDLNVKKNNSKLLLDNKGKNFKTLGIREVFIKKMYNVLTKIRLICLY